MAWHTLGADQVLHSEGVDRRRGLSSAEAAARAQRSGPNKLAAGKAEPPWHAFLRQYHDPMQIGLLAAGIGSIYPLKQLGTGVLLILLTLFNGLAIARTMGMVTFALFLLFFSIESKDERESAFSLDTFSDRTFARTTALSFVLLVLSTALGIFHTVMKTATLGARSG